MVNMCSVCGMKDLIQVSCLCIHLLLHCTFAFELCFQQRVFNLLGGVGRLQSMNISMHVLRKPYALYFSQSIPEFLYLVTSIFLIALRCLIIHHANKLK